MNCASIILNEANKTSKPTWENIDEFGAVSFIIVSCVGIIGCFIAVLVLGKEFFTGRTSTLVIVAALTWVDFIGVLTTSSIIFHGLIVRNGWIAKSPQCEIQAFFTCGSCICSGSIVTFMAIDRTVSLYKPFFYKTAASPNLARAICISILTFCFFLASLPFIGVGNYAVSNYGSYVCHFDWYSQRRTDKLFILVLGSMALLVILTMLLSNVIVFWLVWKLRSKVCKIVPSRMNRSSQRKCVAAKKEQQMAEFVASVSLIFLLTWLPVTVRFFCNFFQVLPSPRADLISTKLAASGFVANPFTYVIFRSIFKRTLRRSVSVVQNSFSQKMFNKTKVQGITCTKQLSAMHSMGDFNSRVVSDIMDPRFINRKSDVELESIAECQ